MLLTFKVDDNGFQHFFQLLYFNGPVLPLRAVSRHTGHDTVIKKMEVTEFVFEILALKAKPNGAFSKLSRCYGNH